MLDLPRIRHIAASLLVLAMTSAMDAIAQSPDRLTESVTDWIETESSPLKQLAAKELMQRWIDRLMLRQAPDDTQGPEPLAAWSNLTEEILLRFEIDRRGASMLPVALAFAEHEASMVRAEIAGVLGLIDAPAAIARLEHYLEDPAPSVRSNAILSYSLSRGVAAAPAIAALLSDPERGVSEQALRELFRLDYAPALAAALKLRMAPELIAQHVSVAPASVTSPHAGAIREYVRSALSQPDTTTPCSLLNAIQDPVVIAALLPELDLVLADEQACAGFLTEVRALGRETLQDLLTDETRSTAVRRFAAKGLGAAPPVPPVDWHGALTFTLEDDDGRLLEESGEVELHLYREHTFEGQPRLPDWRPYQYTVVLEYSTNGYPTIEFTSIVGGSVPHPNGIKLAIHEDRPVGSVRLLHFTDKYQKKRLSLGVRLLRVDCNQC